MKLMEEYADKVIASGAYKPLDRMYGRNKIRALVGDEDGEAQDDQPLVAQLVDLVVKHGQIEDGQTAREILNDQLYDLMTPRPSVVNSTFWEKYQQSPETATDWFYKLCTSNDYVKVAAIKKNVVFDKPTKYGNLEITINLSKPEKDPKAIAAAKLAPQSGYPKCQLCAENEGYAGRMNHPARQNHRIIPITINNTPWFLQYSPYVYYNEHCIAFNSRHTPMKIERATFEKLLSFVDQFPHYFVGSNADLPIVGGSILSHDHFQGGHYAFAMEKAPVETEVRFTGFEDVQAGIVKWPMSVLRLRCADSVRLVELADKILKAWRGYTDESAFIFAETDGTPHNTITPIARRKGEDFELDLVLRNNITTAEHPLGVYHPHAKSRKRTSASSRSWALRCCPPG